MANVVAVDPFRCRMWGGHERLQDCINEESCRAEIESVQRHGQQLPALARPLHGDAHCEFELIYGARRLFVARYLKTSLLVEIKELTDREAVIALDIENRQRQELSPYERGRSYGLWLRNGLFPSQDALARALNVAPSRVSRLINLAQLPPVLLKAFSSPGDICETWGRELLQLWEDPRKRRVLIATGQAIARESGKRPPALVFRRLVSATQRSSHARNSAQSVTRDEVVSDGHGRPLFRVRQQRKETALLLSPTVISPSVLREIKSGIVEILLRATPQDDDFKVKRSPRRRRTAKDAAVSGAAA